MSVEVILLERIEGLGSLGDVAKVAPGYARNYLLPMGKALRANDENKKTFEAEKKKYEAANEEKRIEAEKLMKKVDGAKIKIVRAASETGQLYGSVSARDIAESLSTKGHVVERSSVLIGKAIKDIGEHEVKLRFHADVLATVMVQVVKNADDVVIAAAPSVEDRKLSKTEMATQLKAEKKLAAEKAKLAKQEMKEAEQKAKADAKEEKAEEKSAKASKAAAKDSEKKASAKKPAVKKAAKKK
ncbi:MAG: 50S ribosomal protein L9 [Hydrotalea sp.]|nr:50S ribosomal protein L9 [Hydrotalea sp.]